MTVLIMILMFAIIVLAHEWGHYIAAKKNGVKVNEFAIGMGPKLYSKQKGETLYSIRALPIGGFCAMEGEVGDSHIEGSLQSKKPWQRLVIFAAGAFMNVLLAWALISIYLLGSGYQSSTVEYVQPGMPAAEAGLEKGDAILSVDGVSVDKIQDIIVVLNSNVKLEEGYEFVVEKNNGEIQTLQIIPTSQEDGSVKIGLSGQIARPNVFSAIGQGFVLTFVMIAQVIVGFVQLFTGQLNMDEMAGIVGIVQVSSEAWNVAVQYSLLQAVMSMVSIGAILSANLAVLNLLPLPALDGGRILFTFIEMVRGKPIDPEKEGMVHFAGFVMLMILMVVVFYNDIVRIIG